MVNVFAIPPKAHSGGQLFDLHGALVSPTTIEYEGESVTAFEITNRPMSIAALIHAGYSIESRETE